MALQPLAACALGLAVEMALIGCVTGTPSLDTCTQYYI